MAFDLKHCNVSLKTIEDKLPTTPVSFQDPVYYSDNSIQPKPLKEFVMDSLVEKSEDIWSINISHFKQRKAGDLVKQILEVNFKAEYQGLYILFKTGERLEISKIEGKIHTWLEEKAPNVVQSKAYGPSNADPKASFVAIDMGQSNSANFIVTNDIIKLYFENGKGENNEIDLASPDIHETDSMILINLSKNYKK